MRFTPFLATTIIATLPSVLTASITPRQFRKTDQAIGGCKLFAGKECDDADLIPLSGNIDSSFAFEINTCYEAPTFFSFYGFLQTSTDEYPPENCSFEAYFQSNCKGPRVANQFDSAGTNKCYNLFHSPLTGSYEVGGVSFKLACVRKECA